MSIELTIKEIRALERRLPRAGNAGEYRRLLTVLEVARGNLSYRERGG